jgi:5-methylthioadenosine/S-adenosylhomocysteine deaminase
MQKATQIIHAAWLLTGETQQVVTNHALVVDKGIIVAILPSETVHSFYVAESVEHFANSLLLPGFINSHTHIGMNLFRGLADDRDLHTWLHKHIWPAEQAWLSDEFVYDASLIAAAEMIRGGITTCNEMYFFPQATARAIAQAGMRAHIGITIIDFPTPWAQTKEEYWQKGLDFYNEYQDHQLITPTIAPHAIYTVAVDNLAMVERIARQYNLRITMHVQETAQEVEQAIAQNKQRPLQTLAELGLLTSNFMAIHMTQTCPEDIELLRQHQVNVVHCPESNMKLSSGYCPVSQLLASGINVALGTDSVASNNDLDMIGEMRSAALLAKLQTAQPNALTASTVLAMATLNGARALGVEQQLGSLSVGKSADFIAFALDELEMQPLYNVVSQLVYAGNRQQVSDVWVAGQRLLKNRQLLSLDIAELRDKIKYWQQKIIAQAM